MVDASSYEYLAGDVDSDLVEYLVVVAPSRDVVADLVTAVAELRQAGMLRCLDAVGAERDAFGAVRVFPIDGIETLVGRSDGGESKVGPLLSEHDLELVAISLEPGTTGVVLVAEETWAGPLSAAARKGGGQIAAGERISQRRFRAALGDASVDLLTRPPCGNSEDAAGWASMIVDPVGQLKALAELWTGGLLSSDEFERHKAKVLENWRSPDPSPAR